jgi:O-methyltransferase
MNARTAARRNDSENRGEALDRGRRLLENFISIQPRRRHQTSTHLSAGQDNGKGRELVENRTPLSLLKWLMGVPVAQSIYVAARLGVADALAEGGQSCQELARACSVDEGVLYRVLRMLAGIGLLTEAEGRRFSLTSMGQYLRSNQPGSVRDLAIFIGEKWHLQPWTDLLETVRTGEPAFPRWHGMSFFQYLAENPESSQIFDRAMDTVVSGSAAAVAAACDLEGARIVVDVGGGRGALLMLLLRRYPELRGVLFDLPAVVADAAQEFEAQGLADRCTVAGGDFLESVPAGCDAYFLSRVLHNWNEENAITILKNCRRAMAAGSKVLVVESLMGAAPDFWGSWLDLEMLVDFGSRERRAEEYEELFKRAGLRLSRTIKADATVSILEAVAAE